MTQRAVPSPMESRVALYMARRLYDMVNAGNCYAKIYIPTLEYNMTDTRMTKVSTKVLDHMFKLDLNPPTDQAYLTTPCSKSQ